jgi:mRNA-degrading endonuclease RelE of RelBE toxin-antitoxin system
MSKQTEVKVMVAEGLQQDLERLDPADAKAVMDAIQTKLAENPKDAGEALTGDLAGYYQLVVNGVRVLYKVTDKPAS